MGVIKAERKKEERPGQKPPKEKNGARRNTEQGSVPNETTGGFWGGENRMKKK